MADNESIKIIEEHELQIFKVLKSSNSTVTLSSDGSEGSDIELLQRSVSVVYFDYKIYLSKNQMIL